MKKITAYILVQSLVLLVLSCPTVQTVKKDPAPPLAEVLLKNITEKIEKGTVTSAIGDISYLERESKDVSAERISSLYDEAYKKLQSLFAEKIDKKDYPGAYGIFLSFANSGKESYVPDWSESRLLVLMAEQNEASGNRYLAVSRYLQAVSKKGLPDAGLSHAAELAYGLSNRKALSIFSAEMETRHLAVDARYKKLIDSTPPLADLMKGTPIIWVDKGVKIENGIGMADIILGSGFFIHKDGYLLTNYHVVQSEVDPEYEGFSRLYIKLAYAPTEKIPAKVFAYDKVFDLALLKVEVVPQYVFSSDGPVQFEIGQKVSAIGAPLGLENTLTSGILSNISRRFIQMGNVIQIDAPVNPGNSGGPLVDERNNLLGIVFAGLEKFEGLNFAIPYNLVTAIIPKLYKGGEVTHSWLGMSLHESGGGLEVDYLVPNEPAYAGGIREGDTIESINGKKYATVDAAQEAMLAFDNDMLVAVSWKHAGSVRTGLFSTTLRPYSPIELAIDRDARDNVFLPLFGFEIEPVRNYLWETDYVVKKVIQGSIADDSGVSVDDTCNIKNWLVDKKNRAAFLQIFIKKRKSGYFESYLQLASYLETENFL